MRQIGFSKYEQHLAQRAGEALKQMTELKQLRELIARGANSQPA